MQGGQEQIEKRVYWSFHQVRLRALLQAMRTRVETRALWEQLFTDITQFDDFRHYKAEVGGNGPDFRHQTNGQGLW